jgi:hypothetical protein
LLVVVVVEAEVPQVVPRLWFLEWEALVGRMAGAAVLGVIVLSVLLILGRVLVELEESEQSV